MGVIGIKCMQEASAFFKEKMESEESEETEMYIDTQGIRGRDGPWANSGPREPAPNGCALCPA